MADDRSLFTKHLFMSGCRCPTKLYYKTRPHIYPEREEQWPFIRHVLYNKQQMKGLLKALYPEAVSIERSGYEAASERTERALQRPHAVLFDAGFMTDGLYAKVPLIEKDGDKTAIAIIQTKAFDPEKHSLTGRNGKIHSGWKDYLLDFAYRLYVIRQCRPEWKLEPYLVLPDKTAEARLDRLDRIVAQGEPVKKDSVLNLLAFVPVQHLVDRFWDGREPCIEDEEHPLYGVPFEECLKSMAGWHADGEKVFSGIGKKCSDCEFRVEQKHLAAGEKSGFRECWKGILPDESGKEHVFDLIGAGNRNLIEREIYLQENASVDGDLTPGGIERMNGNLSDRQRRVLQIAKAKGHDVPRELVKPELSEEIRSWEYPLHFLDFEAGSYAVPIRAGHRPYQTVVFQYSCHTLHRDGSLEHSDWLHPADDSHPNIQFIKALCRVPDLLQGTIIQYSGFERSALKKIYRELDRTSDGKRNHGELKRWIDNIVRRDDSSGSKAPFLADMGRMVKNYYYNLAMGGSLSIKEVLRSVMEICPVLEERFTQPYSSRNFDGIVWWQQQKGRVRSPYDILRERREAFVGQGTEAMVAYARLRSEMYEDDQERERLRSGLLSYCELDTLAMVMIYLHWKKLVDKQ